jgi:uncharacterized protein YerC
MQVSRKKISPTVKKQIYSLLHKVVADLKSSSEAKEFLGSFLGESEQEIITRRLGIAYLLSKGKTYSFIKENLAVSSTTVAAIAKEINKGKGFKVALEKIQADEWAEKWAKKINQMFKRRK